MKTSSTIRIGAFCLLLSFGIPGIVSAAAPSDVVGKFGFDWLHPEKARCQAITANAVAGAKDCKHLKEGDTGSFTGKADYYSCKVSSKVEYMIYDTQTRCKEELETMQANAP